LKVLITGGAGFIGSHTADRLLQRGYQVRIIDSLEPPVHRDRQTPLYLSPDAEFILGDVRHQGQMEKALAGVDAVYHLAAYQGYLTDFSRFAWVNDGGTALLYQIIAENRLPIQKVVLASSQAVYGEGKYRCPEHGIQYPAPRKLAQLERRDWEVKCPCCQHTMEPIFTDEDRVKTHNQYSVSKYAQELYALTLGQRLGIPTVALRYSITQGPRQSFYNAYSGILRIYAVRLLTDMSPVIYEDGGQLRDYVSVHDVVTANLMVLENDGADYEVLNVGGGQTVSVREYAELLIRMLGKDIVPECVGEFRYGDSRHIFSDISRLSRLGWAPRTDLTDIAGEYLAWAEAQPELKDFYDDAAKMMKAAGVIRKANQ